MKNQIRFTAHVASICLLALVGIANTSYAFNQSGYREFSLKALDSAARQVCNQKMVSDVQKILQETPGCLKIGVKKGWSSNVLPELDCQKKLNAAFAKNKIALNPSFEFFLTEVPAPNSIAPPQGIYGPGDAILYLSSTYFSQKSKDAESFQLAFKVHVRKYFRPPYEDGKRLRLYQLDTVGSFSHGQVLGIPACDASLRITATENAQAICRILPDLQKEAKEIASRLDVRDANGNPIPYDPDAFRAAEEKERALLSRKLQAWGAPFQSVFVAWFDWDKEDDPLAPLIPESLTLSSTALGNLSWMVRYRFDRYLEPSTTWIWINDSSEYSLMRWLNCGH